MAQDQANKYVVHDCLIMILNSEVESIKIKGKQSYLIVVSIILSSLTTYPPKGIP